MIWDWTTSTILLRLSAAACMAGAFLVFWGLASPQPVASEGPPEEPTYEYDVLLGIAHAPHDSHFVTCGVAHTMHVNGYW